VKSGVTPASISSQFSIGVISAARSAPKLDSAAFQIPATGSPDLNDCDRLRLLIDRLRQGSPKANKQACGQ